MQRMVYVGRHPFLICMYPVFLKKSCKRVSKMISLTNE